MKSRCPHLAHRAVWRRLACATLAVLVAACGDGGTAPEPPPPPNRASVASGTIPAQTLTEGQSATVNVASLFTDPDGDALSFTASTSNAGVAAATVSGSTVTITAVAAGTATITVTARDPGGLTAALSANVAVEPANRAPVVTGSVPTQSLTAGQSVQVNLAPFFSDPDGDALTYTAASSNTAIVTASVSGSTVTITAASVGSATITVSAADPGGLSASVSASVKLAPAKYVEEAHAVVSCMPRVSFSARAVGRATNLITFRSPAQSRDPDCEYEYIAIVGYRAADRASSEIQEKFVDANRLHEVIDRPSRGSSGGVLQIQDSTVTTYSAYTARGENRSASRSATVRNFRLDEYAPPTTHHCDDDFDPRYCTLSLSIQVTNRYGSGASSNDSVWVSWYSVNARNVRVSGPGLSTTEIETIRLAIPQSRLRQGSNTWTIRASGAYHSGSESKSTTYTVAVDGGIPRRCDLLESQCASPYNPDVTVEAVDPRTERAVWSLPSHGGGTAPDGTALVGRIAGERWAACPSDALNPDYTADCDGHRSGSGNTFRAPYFNNQVTSWAVRFEAYARNSNPSTPVNISMGRETLWARLDRTGCGGDDGFAQNSGSFTNPGHDDYCRPDYVYTSVRR